MKRTNYSVRGNGFGIDPEQKEKGFEIFHRLNPEGMILAHFPDGFD